MKHNIRTSIVIGLVVIAMCSFVTGCANKKDSAAANSNDDLSNKSSQVENQLPNSNDESSSSSSTDFQAPEEGYYSNDYDEILKIQKSDDNTYNIEYSITKLLYVENAVGTYNSETGILSFSGGDDGGAVFEADVVNKGDHLEVTVTQSSYKDAVGSVQSFYKADDPR